MHTPTQMAEFASCFCFLFVHMQKIYAPNFNNTYGGVSRYRNKVWVGYSAEVSYKDLIVNLIIFFEEALLLWVLKRGHLHMLITLRVTA